MSEVYLKAAQAAADGFQRDTLFRIGLVLEDHTQALAGFMVDVQTRLEAAEYLLSEIASCTRADPNRKCPDSTPRKGKWRTLNVPAATMDKIDALLASAKLRNEDGNDD